MKICGGGGPVGVSRGQAPLESENVYHLNRPLVINPLFSLVMTITMRDIFHYFSPAIYLSLNNVFTIWILLQCFADRRSFHNLDQF